MFRWNAAAATEHFDSGCLGGVFPSEFVPEGAHIAQTVIVGESNHHGFGVSGIADIHGDLQRLFPEAFILGVDHIAPAGVGDIGIDGVVPVLMVEGVHGDLNLGTADFPGGIDEGACFLFGELGNPDIFASERNHGTAAGDYNIGMYLTDEGGDVPFAAGGADADEHIQQQCGALGLKNG